jgi:hypothetical protein
VCTFPSLFLDIALSLVERTSERAEGPNCVGDASSPYFPTTRSPFRRSRAGGTRCTPKGQIATCRAWKYPL